MNKNDFHVFGKVYKKHGYRGHLNLYSEKQLLNIDSLKFLYLEEDSELIPFFVEKIRKKKKYIYIVKFEDIDTDTKTKPLLNKIFYVDKKLINIEEKENINYFSVIDINMGEIGVVEKVENLTSNQKLIHVKGEKNFIIPFHDESIKKINKKNNFIQVEISEDLININD